MELEQSEYWVCENAGKLEVVVRRRGTNATRVTANIRAKPLSARGGLDFISSSEGLLIFPPGRYKLLVDFLSDFQTCRFSFLILFVRYFSVWFSSVNDEAIPR